MIYYNIINIFLRKFHFNFNKDIKQINFSYPKNIITILSLNNLIFIFVKKHGKGGSLAHKTSILPSQLIYYLINNVITN